MCAREKERETINNMENLYAFGRFLNQTYFIPAPTFTDKELPDQTGKVRKLANVHHGFAHMTQ